MNDQNSLQTRLNEVLLAADNESLVALVKMLAKGDIAKCQQSIEFLQQYSNNEAQELPFWDPLPTWQELESSVSEMIEDPGHDEEIEALCDELYDFAATLNQYHLQQTDRTQLLDELMALMDDADYGIDEALIDVADATCDGKIDFADLALRYEQTGKNLLIKNAIQSYRKADDDENYLRLRLTRLNSCADYHDLATFYWDRGERNKAVATATHGMAQAGGSPGKLRPFLADAAKDMGDKETYLNLYFEEHSHYLTLTSYKAFEALCSETEWSLFEPNMIALLDDEHSLKVAEINDYRKDYQRVLRYFTAATVSERYYSRYGDYSLAEAYEKRFPEQILSFYRTVVGKLNESHSRDTYTHQAEMFAKIRRLLVDIIQRPDEWRAYARQIKRQNSRRPAFQQEFGKAVVDWYEL
jgi:hypothetical protein